MFYRTICVCLVGFVLAISAERYPLEIKFKINLINMSKADQNGTKLICDHNDNDKQTHIYTVREGEEFNIITEYNYYINFLICCDYNNNNILYKFTKDVSLNVTTFKVEKNMGTLWNCTVLTNQNNPIMLPSVQYKNDQYSAAYCYMKIHVRQKSSPQTILVNNMVLEAVRTDLSEKNIDFTAEYQYAHGDVVDVTCVNFLNPAPLTMEYAMAGTMSEDSTMKELSSDKVVGFRAKLHSGHNKSYMICTNTEPTDYTKVMVTFVMQTEFHIVSIKINGMTLRPKLKNASNNHYEIEYKYVSHQTINVVCEVQRTDAKLVVVDQLSGFVGKVDNYKKTVLIPEKKVEMSFYLEPKDDKKNLCWSDYLNGTSAEQVAIRFTDCKFALELYPLKMELPSNGTVMELYNDDKLKVIYYEFKDGETLQLKCGPLFLPKPGPVLYLQFKDSDKCKTNGCIVSKTLKVASNGDSIEICYLKEKIYPPVPNKEDNVLREIRVILRKRVLTTTSTTTTMEPPIDAETTTASSPPGALPETEEKVTMLAVIFGAVLCIVVICVCTVIVKLRKRKHAQGGPFDRNYEHLQSPSETSIPAYPPQWESNYAVPVDRRAEDNTYSVPCQETALYSTPTPKNLRNKNQKPVDPTYAVLEIPEQKNTLKETDDPNYSENGTNRQEQCYAKVLPKSVRNKVAYSYVKSEPAYANAAEPEPMYCEPAKAQGGTYANINNSHYANSNAQEYVEPTYCEPQKRMK